MLLSHFFIEWRFNSSVKILFGLMVAFLLPPFLANAYPSELDRKDYLLDSPYFDKDGRGDYERLCSVLSPSSSYKSDSVNQTCYEHVIAFVSEDGSEVKLKEGLTLSINWWYRSTSKKWKKEDRLYITYDTSSSKFKVWHINLNETAWSSQIFTTPQLIPTIEAMRKVSIGNTEIKISNGCVFKIDLGQDLSNWHVKDQVLIFANSDTEYQIWNSKIKSIVLGQPIKDGQFESKIQVRDVLTIEDRLNKKVLQQSAATKAIARTLVNYVAGLKEKQRPIAVFLFLGPTGVGKTELAKLLTEEIYNDSSALLRFDMSHFAQSHSIVRLIGSPPGYVNHEEGGQLTEPLLENGQRIILLDELEKADPQVLKVFLPVFDEGFILNNKNIRVDCSEVIFIMTSNLCGPQIAELYHHGFSEEEILAIIEPSLIQALSPELYNRVEPILFRPLAKETMHALVDLMLKQLEEKLFLEKKVTIQVDHTVKTFLIEQGYHPLLGARPLRKLIEKRIVSELAYYMIQQDVQQEVTLTLFYDNQSDSVIIQ